jgi:type III secretion system FlhB-like substrate exporter
MKCFGDFGIDNIPPDNSSESAMGFKIKAPKISISKPKITVPTSVKGIIKDVGKVGGQYAQAINPLQQIKSIATKIPVISDVYRETDKFTGGTITKLTNVSNLPAKALQGKPISKQELIEAAMVTAQVAAIVASGGSASALIGAGAGALKNGPLGKTSLGRNLLTFAEIAGNAAALHSAAGTQLAQQAGKTATDAASQAVQDKAMAMAKTETEKEFQKKTGIPVSMVTKIYDVTSGKEFDAQTPRDVLNVVAEDQLKKAGLGDSVTQAILSNNAAQLGVAISKAPDLALDKAEREIAAQKIKLESATKLENIKKNIESKADKTLSDATDIEKLREKAEKEVNAEAKKLLQKELANALQGFLGNQRQLVNMAERYQIEAAQDSVLIAAAEEGRLKSKIPVIMGGIAAATVLGLIAYNTMEG